MGATDSPERLRRVRDLFSVAVEKAPRERRAFLDEAAGADESLRDEVLALLADEEAAGDLLSRPVSMPESMAPAATGGPRPSLEGRRIGPYQIVDEIGHGGMGTVYRAIRADDAYQKTVALKLVRSAAASDVVQQRFLRERQILGRLQHPNIATVFDGGTTEEGQPYLVMEYVEGEPIDRYCSVREVPTRQRLEMFRDVCAAVHYAHQNLVVHRDLKPGNILVTADGTPKLLDFGIAKLLAAGLDPEEAPTATLLPVMTPEYASPEQVRGQPVTTASDVYSLGVVLYELLTGRRPYVVRTESMEEIVRAVCGTEAHRPSTMVRPADAGPRRLPVTSSDLHGDLDTIVLKALRKEPARRYLSVQELAEDIRRHLAGLPVSARKDTFGYRAGKFIRRNRLAAGLSGLLVLTLIGGVAATVRQAWIAHAQRERAERRFQDVRKLANSFLFEFHDAIADLPGSTKARALVVKRALEYLDSLAGEASGDAALQAELAGAYQRVGDVQGLPYTANLGDSAGALRSFERAYGIRLELLRSEPDDAGRLAAACQAGTRVGKVLLARGDGVAARGRFEEALPWCEGAWRAKQQDPAALEMMLRARMYVADGWARSGDPARAAALDEALIRETETVASGQPFATRMLAWTYDRLAQALQQQGKVQASVPALRKGVELAERVAREAPGVRPNRRNLGVEYENLAAALRQTGDYAGGLEAVAKARAIYEAQRKEDPADGQAALDVASAETGLAELLRASGRQGEALAAYGRALALVEAAIGSNPGSVFAHALAATTVGGIGDIHLARREYDLSVEALRKAVAERETIQTTDPQYPENRHEMAMLYRSLGRAYAAATGKASEPGEACGWYERALDTLHALQVEKVAPVPPDSEIEALSREREGCSGARAPRPTTLQAAVKP